MRTPEDVKRTLVAKLRKAWSIDPTKMAEIGPLLEKLQGVPKEAVAKDTEEFVRWTLSTQAPMSSSEVEAFVSRTLNIKTSNPVTRVTGPRFKKGDSVQIIESKHKLPKYDIANYKLYDGKIGIVTETDDLDVLVSIKGVSAPVRFPGGMSATRVGIFKYTAPYDVQGSAKIEMIYFAGGKATEDATIVVDAYQGRAKGTERRSANYYTGHVVFASTGGNGYYFRGFPQQRMQVNPNSEGGFMPRTFNPSLGEVYYIGLFGKRPSNWKAELESLDTAAEEAMGGPSKTAALSGRYELRAKGIGILVNGKTNNDLLAQIFVSLGVDAMDVKDILSFREGYTGRFVLKDTYQWIADGNGKVSLAQFVKHGPDLYKVDFSAASKTAALSGRYDLRVNGTTAFVDGKSNPILFAQILQAATGQRITVADGQQKTPRQNLLMLEDIPRSQTALSYGGVLVPYIKALNAAYETVKDGEGKIQPDAFVPMRGPNTFSVTL